ncbi:MAG: hypothetical protein ACXVIJ_06235 [Thermoanaerobaculia bacterium]
MQDDETPRLLPERTGKHRCIVCLKDVAEEEYFRNDFLCDACVERDEFPLQSTPEQTR